MGEQRSPKFSKLDGQGKKADASKRSRDDYQSRLGKIVGSSVGREDATKEGVAKVLS